MTETQTRISKCINAHPGIHFSGLVDQLSLARGQTQHHLRKLTATDHIISEKHFGKRHYYPTEYDAWERKALALCHRDTVRGILIYLLDSGPADYDRLTTALDISAGTLSWHLSRLDTADLITKQRVDGAYRVSVTHPDTTADLLATATPSPQETTVSKFERLFDGFLYD